MKWIVFEGPDGAGKTTLLDIVADTLTARGHHVVQTREPGGRYVPPVLRELALDAPDVMTRQLLMAADARYNYVANVEPYDGTATLVVQDRGQWSALVYSGLEDPLVESLGHCGRAPDLYVYVDTPLEARMHRLQARPEGARNVFDDESLVTQRRRQLAYLDLVESSDVPVLVVRGDGARPEGDAHSLVLQIEDLLD